MFYSLCFLQVCPLPPSFHTRPVASTLLPLNTYTYTAWLGPRTLCLPRKGWPPRKPDGRQSCVSWGDSSLLFAGRAPPAPLPQTEDTEDKLSPANDRDGGAVALVWESG